MPENNNSMKKEEKAHILDEISAIQDRLQSLTKQLDEESGEVPVPEDDDVVHDEDIPVIYIETAGKEGQQQAPPEIG